MKNMKKGLAGIVVVVLLAIGYFTGILPTGNEAADVNATVTAAITEPQAIADYLF